MNVVVGCPDDLGIRSKVWKLLLSYLPVKTPEWSAHLQKQRAAYSQFVDEVILQPGTAEHENNRTDVTMEDHPLNPHPESKWSQYFQDNEMLVQIDKDCRRLCPGLAFFQNPSLHTLDVLTNSKNRFETLRQRVEHSMLKAQTVSTNWVGINIAMNKKPTKRPTDDLLNLQEGQEAHWEVVERILFVYAKLNPGQGYVQGMNEIIGPIYYTFSLDNDEMNYGQAEADTFWCFTNLMSEIRDNFIKHLDDSACGIGERMDKFMRMLKDKDTTLWLKLQEQDLKPQYYAFRWITLLLSQEFELPDVQRLWDSLLADCQRFEFLISVCCAMLVLVREELLKSDFSANMKLVQNYPSMDIHLILAKAVELAGMR